MDYRNLGRSGIKVGIIGLGCEGFSGKSDDQARRMVDCAMNGGVNFIDLYASNPQMRSSIGAGLKGRRDQWIVQGHLCTIWKNEQYERTREIEPTKKSFEDLCARLQTDYIDVGMIHYIDTMPDLYRVCEGGILRYAQELRASGRIRSLGISSHNPFVAQLAIKTGLIDTVMFSINPCYDLQPPSDTCESLFDKASYAKPMHNMHPVRETFYETCAQNNVGISAMKVFGGGDLLDPNNSPIGKAFTPVQCLHYALTRPAVSVALSGAHSEAEIEQALRYFEATDEEKDYAPVLANIDCVSYAGHCMYCGHCAPCPQHIDVAMVTKLYNLCKSQGCIVETCREHYALLEHHAGECIQCGACETRCPFRVEIRKTMKKATTLFGR